MVIKVSATKEARTRWSIGKSGRRCRWVKDMDRKGYGRGMDLKIKLGLGGRFGISENKDHQPLENFIFCFQNYSRGIHLKNLMVCLKYFYQYSILKY